MLSLSLFNANAELTGTPRRHREQRTRAFAESRRQGDTPVLLGGAARMTFVPLR